MTSDEYTRVVRLEAYEVELVSHLRDLMDPDRNYALSHLDIIRMALRATVNRASGAGTADRIREDLK